MSQLVNPEERKVHLSLVLILIHAQNFTPPVQAYSISAVDLSELTGLIWFGMNFEMGNADRVIPALIQLFVQAQPELAYISTEGVTDRNFREWVARQMALYGSWISIPHTEKTVDKLLG